MSILVRDMTRKIKDLSKVTGDRKALAGSPRLSYLPKQDS